MLIINDMTASLPLKKLYLAIIMLKNKKGERKD